MPGKKWIFFVRRTM